MQAQAVKAKMIMPPCAIYPGSCPYRHAILDRDGKFGEEVTDLRAASGMKPTRVSPASFGRRELRNVGSEAVAESGSII